LGKGQIIEVILVLLVSKMIIFLICPHTCWK